VQRELSRLTGGSCTGYRLIPPEAVNWIIRAAV